MSLLRKVFGKYTETVGEKNEIDHLFALALFYQRVFGHQVLDPNWSWKKYGVQQILIAVLFIYVFFGTLQCLQTTHDLELLSEACYTVIVGTVVPLKIIVFIKNRFIFRGLYVAMKTTIVDVIRRDPGGDIRSALKTGRKIVVVLFCTVIIPFSVYEMTTLWNYIVGKRTLLSRSTMTLMPLTTPYFEIAWFLHTIFFIVISSSIILDMWFIILVFFKCAALKSLVNILKIDRKNKFGSEESYTDRLEKALQRFHRTHLKLNEFFFNLNEMCKLSAFIPLLNAAICTCLILLLMSQGVNWRFAVHMLPVFAEIFAYNWFGEKIKTKMHDVWLELLYFDWTSLKPKDKKSYFIIVLYMTQEFSLKTVSGNDLSLITMSAILKISYQAFTVLRTTNN